jgi:hypothetical protein
MVGGINCCPFILFSLFVEAIFYLVYIPLLELYERAGLAYL